MPSDTSLAWWEVVLGGFAVSAATFALLWAFVILDWMLEA